MQAAADAARALRPLVCVAAQPCSSIQPADTSPRTDQLPGPDAFRALFKPATNSVPLLPCRACSPAMAAAHEREYEEHMKVGSWLFCLSSEFRLFLVTR